ncbi:hypothetical protein AMECASPLE_027234 [Ameca splendens]|uniref:Uncharacterized protein n=1 Tax=Ameca splendens TaxID=208324 RepID=A0ABV0Z3Y5_9TELE
MDFAFLPAPCLIDWISGFRLFSASGFLPLPAPCLTPLALELDSVSVPGFTPQPSHWFIHPEPAWLSSPPGIIVKRTITASADSPEDLDQSAIRLQSVGFFLINCLDHILFWILRLIPRLRSDSWKLTAALLLSDPELLNKPFNFSLCVWLNLGSLSQAVICTVPFFTFSNITSLNVFY